MDDKNKGLYRKFIIRRTDGRSAPGEKHYRCNYFVLDLTHDPHAKPAILAYADSAEAAGYKALAWDLRAELTILDRQNPTQAAVQDTDGEVGPDYPSEAMPLG